MQIIIVGCGKVGRTLAEQLQEEDTDLTLIDISADKINSISDDIDALYVIGNGASIKSSLLPNCPENRTLPHHCPCT